MKTKFLSKVGSKLEGDWGEILALEGSGGGKTSPDIYSFCKKSLLVLKTKWKYLSQTDMKFSDNLANYINRCSGYFGMQCCLLKCEENIVFSNVISFFETGSC